jgi:hypothetical protein
LSVPVGARSRASAASKSGEGPKRSSVAADDEQPVTTASKPTAKKPTFISISLMNAQSREGVGVRVVARRGGDVQRSCQTKAHDAIRATPADFRCHSSFTP